MLKMEVLSTLIVFITIKNQMQFIWILTIFNVLLHKVISLEYVTYSM